VRVRVEEDAGPLRAFVTHYPEPTDVGTHIHATFEVCVQLSGEVEWYMEDVVARMEPGDVWLWAPWEIHGWRCRMADSLSLTLRFLPQFVGEESFQGHPWLTLFGPHPARRPRVSTGEMRREALDLAHRLRREIEEKREAWVEAVRLGLLQLLLLLYREWDPSARRVSDNDVQMSELARVIPAIGLAYSQTARRLKLAEAAAACGMSVSRFGRLFRRVMGITFPKFSLRVRLGYAAHLLRSTDRTMEAVAAAAGFSDASHLHREFTRSNGRTPGEFRRMYQAQSASQPLPPGE